MSIKEMCLESVGLPIDIMKTLESFDIAVAVIDFNGVQVKNKFNPIRTIALYDENQLSMEPSVLRAIPDPIRSGETLKDILTNCCLKLLDFSVDDWQVGAGCYGKVTFKVRCEITISYRTIFLAEGIEYQNVFPI